MTESCDRSYDGHIPFERRQFDLLQLFEPVLCHRHDVSDAISDAIFIQASIKAFVQHILSAPRSPGPHPTKFRGYIQDFSLQSRRWWRLKDKLLPLLLREQDFESSIHLMEIMKTSSSLSDLLNKNTELLESLDYDVAEAILGMLDMVKALMSELTSVFQRKYQSLKHTKSAANLIFEFPNNIRHICTTMPWTIMPALIVLWGVCWMFIIGSQAVDGNLTPTFSPTPTANELFDASFTTDLQNPSTALFDSGDQDSLNSLFYSAAADHTLNPLDWGNGSPLDPDFLTAGIVSDDQPDINELGIIHGSAVEAQSNELLHGNNLPNPESSGRRRNGQKGKQLVVCSICQRSFAALFTLKRHQAYTHSNVIATQKTLYLCPNAGCKRSKDKHPFLRKDSLTRHLLKCRYKQSPALGEGTPSVSPPSPIRSTDILGSLGYPEDHNQEGVGHLVGQKRTRLENTDDGPDNERLLDDMMEKFRRLSDEVEKKERELAAAKNARDSFEKAILALKGL